MILNSGAGSSSASNLNRNPVQINLESTGKFFQLSFSFVFHKYLNIESTSVPDVIQLVTNDCQNLQGLLISLDTLFQVFEFFFNQFSLLVVRSIARGQDGKHPIEKFQDVNMILGSF